LLHKLDHYGICGKVNVWTSAFLSGRQQRVVVEGSASPYVSVTSGVPQGSVLGPILFLLYVNDLGEGINSNIRLFADYIIYRSIGSDDDCRTLQNDIDKIAVWERDWQMSLNISKCHILSVSRKTKNIDFHYELHGSVLERVNSAKYLGVTLDDKLSDMEYLLQKIFVLKATRVMVCSGGT